MSNRPAWPETESLVFHPALGIGAMIAILFLAFVVFILAAVASALPAGQPRWVMFAVSGTWALAGMAALVFFGIPMLRPTRIRHAVINGFSEISAEPVICETPAVHFRLTHELVETDSGWMFRPRQGASRMVERGSLILGVPLLMGVATFLACLLHDQYGWTIAISIGCMGALGGGFHLALMVTLAMLDQQRYAVLRIPPHHDQPLLYSLEMRGLGQSSVRPDQLRIQWDELVAVQLCPWKLVVKELDTQSTTWAVQGVLVIKHSQSKGFERLPLCLTCNYPGAAQVMGILADILEVPYLFHADATGWRAEEVRARQCPPLTRGSMAV